MIQSRKFSYLIAVVIIVTAFFKYWLMDLFTGIVSSFITVLGGNPHSVLNFLNANSNYSVYQDHYLGWFIYYPLYLGLHFLFIFALFSGELRRKIFLGVASIIVALLALIVIGKAAGVPALFQISFACFQNLFALPFILLVIEGGRILWSDIEKKLD